MSGSKSGEIVLAPVNENTNEGTALAAGVIVVVGGAVMLVSTAVNAFLEAREKIRVQREQECRELRREVDRSFDEWKKSEMLSEREAMNQSGEVSPYELDSVARPERSPAQVSFQENLAKLISEEKMTAISSPDNGGGSAQYVKSVALKAAIRELVDTVTLASSNDVVARLHRLAKESDLNKAVAQANEIRVLVAHELATVAREQAEARKMLGDLPPDFPGELRSLLQDVVNGQGRLDENVREHIKAGDKATEASRKKMAAKILNKALSELGYQVETIRESLFIDGGAIHFRNDDWDDGYCVRLTVTENQNIHFDMQRDIKCDTQDKCTERVWEAECKELLTVLKEAGIGIEKFQVNSEPGQHAVVHVDNFPIETKKGEMGNKKRKQTKGQKSHVAKENVK